MLGQYNRLQIVKELDFGMYLDGEEWGEILLPRRYVPKEAKIDDFIEVFIYLDSEDRLIATTEKPYATVGDFAYLKVAAVNAIGAFLNWGLLKDLLVPFKEQKQKMEVGRSYVVYIYVDEETERIAASCKLEKFLDNTPHEFKEGEEVDLLIYKPTDIGYKAIINGSHSGIVYKNEVFQSLRTGSKVKGFIKKIRPDGKIDLSLQKAGYKQVVDGVSAKILKKLKQENGFIAVTDKSPAPVIYHKFGVSKKSYKKAVGALYKQRKIKIERNGIRLIN